MRKTLTLIGCGLVLLGGVTVPSFAVQAPTSGVSTPGPKKVDPRQIQALLQQGMDALTVGDAKIARDSFADAIQLDPRNPKALHGLGLTYYALHDLPKAAAALDRAVVVPGAVDHALAYNAGVINIENKVPMRAAKIARDYLNSNPTPLDEPVVNVIGLALERADSTTQKNAFYADTKTFYDRYVKRLEAANPGFLRWGPEWLPADDVKVKIKTNADLQPSIVSQTKELADMESRLKDSRKKLAIMEAQLARFQIEPYTVDQQREETRSLEERRDRKKADLDASTGQLIKPDAMPELTNVIAMDTPVPTWATPVAKVVVAKADNTGSDPNADTPVRTTKPKRIRKPKLDPAEDPKPANPGEQPATPAEKPADPPAVTPPAEPQPLDTPAPRKKIRLTMYAAAFPVAKDLVITSLAAVDATHDISLQTREGTVLTGEVVRSDANTGLALIRVKGGKLAYFDLADAQAGKISCAAFPEVNLFAPEGELLTGTATAPSAKWTVRLSKHPRLPGGPLIQNSKVVGVELGTRDNDLGMIPAVTMSAIKDLLAADAPTAAGGNPDPTYAILQLSAVKDRD